MAEEKKKYEEIMSRLDRYKNCNTAEVRAPDAPNESRPRPISGRYQGGDAVTSLDEFGDEDFKLSTDNH